MSEADLSTRVRMTIQAGPVANTPIDTTLAIAGAAADAKTVGDELALKANRSELASAITVNGESADNEGAIIIDGRVIQVSDTDTRSIGEAIADADARNAETIPMSADPDAPSVAEEMGDFVRISEQTLGEDDKEQVRENIGAAPRGMLDGKLGYVQLASVPGGSSKTYVLEADSKVVFITFGSTLATKGLWVVNLGNLAVTILNIAQAASLNMTATSGKVTIENTASVGTRVYAIVFAGSVSDET